MIPFLPFFVLVVDNFITIHGRLIWTILEPLFQKMPKNLYNFGFLNG